MDKSEGSLPQRNDKPNGSPPPQREAWPPLKEKEIPPLAAANVKRLVETADFNQFFDIISVMPVDEQCNKLTWILMITCREIEKSNQNLRITKLPLFVVKIINKFNALLQNKDNPIKVKGRVIAILLQSAGKIFAAITQDTRDKELPKIASDTIKKILNQLLLDPDVNAQDILNALLGISLLADPASITGDLDPKSLEELLTALPRKPSCTTIILVNALQYVSQIASTNYLIEKINIETLNELFKKLKDKWDLTSDDIANALERMGEIANRGHLNGSFSAEILNELFKQIISDTDSSAKSITTSLLAVFHVAKAENLDEKLEVNQVNTLLKQLLTKPDLDVKVIPEVLDCVKQMEEMGKLTGALDRDVLSGLQARSPTIATSSPPQDVLITLRGINKLAVEKQFNKLQEMLVGTLKELDNPARELQANKIQILVIEIISRVGVLIESGANPAVSSLSNLLYDAGIILIKIKSQLPTDKKQLTIQNDLITKLLNYVLLNSNAHEIADIFYGIGCMADASYLSGEMNTEIFNQMLEKILKEEINDHVIAIALDGLGSINNAGYLKSPLNTEMLIDLVRKLQKMRNLSAQTIAIVLCALVRCNINPPRDLITALINPLSEKKLADHEIVLIAQALLVFELPIPRFLSSLLKQQRRTPNQHHQAVVTSLSKKQGIKEIKTMKLIGAWFVDIFLELKNGTKIIVILDGHHQYQQDGTLRVEERRQDQWLQGQGFQILRIPDETSPEEIISKIKRKFAADIERSLKMVILNEKQLPSDKTKVKAATSSAVAVAHPQVVALAQVEKTSKTVTAESVPPSPKPEVVVPPPGFEKQLSFFSGASAVTQPAEKKVKILQRTATAEMKDTDPFTKTVAKLSLDAGVAELSRIPKEEEKEKRPAADKPRPETQSIKSKDDSASTIVKPPPKILQKSDAGAAAILDTLYAAMLCQMKPPNLAALLSKLEGKHLDDKGIFQLAQALALFDVAFPAFVSEALLSQRPSQTQAQKQVVDALSANLNIKEIKTAELIGAWFFSIFIELKNGKKIIVELNCTPHYTKDEKLTPDYQRQDKWLSSKAYRVLRFKDEIPLPEIIEQIKQEILADKPRSQAGRFYKEKSSTEKTGDKDAVASKFENR